MVPPDADKLLELDSRRRIYEHVCQVPGAHLRQLQRELEIPLGTLEYHLRQLERNGMVVTRSEARFKSYYPSTQIDRRDRDLLYYLRQEVPRRIALEIADQPGITFRDLAALLPVSPSTLSFHLKKLVKATIVGEVPAGRSKAYTCADADRVRRLIVEYRATFVDDVVDRFAAAWLNLSP